MTEVETPTQARRVRTAIVMGAGGTVGVAYHAGVLKALLDAGITTDSADLMVGTSAGAIASSVARTGHDIDDLWNLTQDDVNPFDEDAPFLRPEIVYQRGWRTPAGLGRRIVGGAYVVQRSITKWPTVSPPKQLQRYYRAGFGSVTEQRAEYATWTGEEWPEQRLALCAFDIVSGKRLVMGDPKRRSLPLPDAIRAASAVPMLYPPVRHGKRMLVDGVVHSATNIDVAVDAGAELIIVAAPQSYDPDSPPPLHIRSGRELFHRRTERELRKAREAGARVLMVRPSPAEVDVHGLNLLRKDGHAETAALAREHTAEIMDSLEGRSFRKAWNAAVKTTRRENLAAGSTS